MDSKTPSNSFSKERWQKESFAEIPLAERVTLAIKEKLSGSSSSSSEIQTVSWMLVSKATPETHHPLLAALPPECMYKSTVTKCFVTPVGCSQESVDRKCHLKQTHTILGRQKHGIILVILLTSLMFTVQRTKKLLNVLWFWGIFYKSSCLDCDLRWNLGHEHGSQFFLLQPINEAKYSARLSLSYMCKHSPQASVSELSLSQDALLFSHCTKDTTHTMCSQPPETDSQKLQFKKCKFILVTNIHIFSFLLKLTYLHSWWMTNQITNQLQEIHRCVLMHLLSSLVCLLVCPSKSPHVEKPWEGKKKKKKQTPYFGKNHKYNLFLLAKERIAKATQNLKAGNSVW